MVIRLRSSVVVDHVDVLGPLVSPSEDHAPLIVHADAVEPREVTLQCFQPIRWGRPKVVESLRIVKHIQLSRHDLGYLCPSFAPRVSAFVEEVLDFTTAEASERHVRLYPR